MQEHRIRLHENDATKAEVLGLEMPTATVHHRSGDILVLKVPGHSAWMERGVSAYVPVQFQVWRVVADDDDGLMAARVTSFNVR
jgi:hypothetical protein